MVFLVIFMFKIILRFVKEYIFFFFWNISFKRVGILDFLICEVICKKYNYYYIRM